MRKTGKKLPPQKKVVKEMKRNKKSGIVEEVEIEKVVEEDETEPLGRSAFERNVFVGRAHKDLHGGNLLIDTENLVWLIDFADVDEETHVFIDI